jgi:hypothetical protein
MTLAQNGFDTPAALAAFVLGFAAIGLVLLTYESERLPGWRERLRRAILRLSRGSDLAWIDARLLTSLAAAAFALATATTWALGEYGCTSGGPSDLTTLVTSGREFLHGGNPFTITACGVSTNPVPAGLASVLIDALGSLAGPAGVLAVWGAVSVALVPLLWSLGGAGRARATVFVLGSFLYLPIVAVQVDGASLALVPLAVLLVLDLSRRGWPRAGAVGGFLATGRFPALFPVVAASGRAGVRRWLSGGLAVGVFAVVTLATAGVYGGRFLEPVFFTQFARSHFALNYWGVLEGAGGVQPSTIVTLVQAGLTVALVAVCWAKARTGLGAAAIVLTGTILLTQFLSFTELVFLVPVALVGPRARWWLWGIGVVASTNYLLALRSLANVGGPYVLSYALDLVLSGLVLGLLVDLLVTELGTSGSSAPSGTGLANQPSGEPARGLRPPAPDRR